MKVYKFELIGDLGRKYEALVIEHEPESYATVIIGGWSYDVPSIYDAEEQLEAEYSHIELVGEI